jgi:hypothetical protein
VCLRVPRAAAITSDNPPATVPPIAADTQSKPVGGDGSRATGADTTVVLSSCAPHARRSSYSCAADAAIEDGGGGTAEGSHVTIGRAEAVGAMTAAATASAATAPVNLLFERIWTSLRIGDRRVRSIEGQRAAGRSLRSQAAVIAG